MSVLSNVKHRLHVCAAWEYPWLRVLLSINNTRGGGECGVVRCSGSRPSPTTTIQQQQQWQLLSPGKAPCFSAQCSTFVKRKMTIYQSAVYSTCHLLRKYKSETKRFGNLIDQIQLFTATLIITSLPYFGVKLSCVCLMFAFRKNNWQTDIWTYWCAFAHK